MFLFPVLCFSQESSNNKTLVTFEQELGFGIGINTNTNYMHSDETMLTANVDLLNTNRFLYGIEFGLGKTISEEQNYSGTVSQFAYDEDIEGVVYSQIVFAGRIGYRINQSFHIIATIGGSFFNQYQERFDSFYILGTDGWYYVHTDVSKTEAYVKGSVVYKINQFGIELGLANSGFGVGLNYFF